MHILFICTGNTCRSPMAEGIAKAQAEKRGLEFQFSSAGISVFPGEVAHPNAVQAAMEFGADISGHRASGINIEIIEKAGPVVCMSDTHRTYLTKLYPGCADKFRLLPGGDITDPFNNTQDVYNQTAIKINEAVARLLDELINNEE